MRTLWLFVATAGLAFAQLDSDTITITATGQTAALQPDEVSVHLSVNAARNLGLEEVLKAFTGVAVSEANLTAVSDSGVARVCAPLTSGCSPARAWTFSLTAPLPKLNETLKALAAIDAARQPGISIYYSIGSNVGQAAAPECAYPPLISQARRHAENVAAAAGLRVGSVVAMSDGTGALRPDSAPVRSVDALSGLFSWVVPNASFVFDPYTSAAPGSTSACAAVVQFKLLR